VRIDPHSETTQTNMNRSDLIQRLSKLHPQLLVKDSEQAVSEIIDAISATLANGGRVEIRGFGQDRGSSRSACQGCAPFQSRHCDTKSRTEVVSTSNEETIRVTG
jgi:nucleoid DNA-binding protein